MCERNRLFYPHETIQRMIHETKQWTKRNKFFRIVLCREWKRKPKLAQWWVLIALLLYCSTYMELLNDRNEFLPHQTMMMMISWMLTHCCQKVFVFLCRCVSWNVCEIVYVNRNKSILSTHNDTNLHARWHDQFTSAFQMILNCQGVAFFRLKIISSEILSLSQKERSKAVS